MACRVADFTDTWLDLATGLLVLVYPHVELRGDFGLLLDHALAQRPQQEHSSHLWPVVLQIMQVRP